MENREKPDYHSEKKRFTKTSIVFQERFGFDIPMSFVYVQEVL